MLILWILCGMIAGSINYLYKLKEGKIDSETKLLIAVWIFGGVFFSLLIILPLRLVVYLSTCIYDDKFILFKRKSKIYFSDSEIALVNKILHSLIINCEVTLTNIIPEEYIMLKEIHSRVHKSNKK